MRICDGPQFQKKMLFSGLIDDSLLVLKCAMWVYGIILYADKKMKKQFKNSENLWITAKITENFVKYNKILAKKEKKGHGRKMSPNM